MTARTSSDVFREFSALQREVKELQENLETLDSPIWNEVSELVTRTFDSCQEISCTPANIGISPFFLFTGLILYTLSFRKSPK